MTDNNTPERDEQTPPPAKKGRGWWWKIPLILLLLLAVLLLLLPTLASTGAARRMVLSRVNEALPGKLDVGGWSLGWFSGTSARDVTWTDAEGREVASVREVDTPITIWQVIRGDMRLGEIVIDGVRLDVVIPITEEAEARIPDERQPDLREPVNIPDFVARLRIQDVAGNVRFVAPDGSEALVKIDNATRLDLNFPGGGAASTVEALVAIQQPSGTATVNFDANVSGLKAGPLDLANLTGQGALAIRQLDLDHAGAILRAMGQEIAVQGILGGQIDFAMPAQGQGIARGEFNATNVAANVGDDRITTKTLRIPVDVELTGGQTPRAVVRQLGLVLDQGQVAMTADVPLRAIDQLQNNQAVTDEGTAQVLVSVPDVPAVMNSLRNTLNVQEDVQITGGLLEAEVNVDIGPGGITVRAPASLRELAGTRGEQKIGPLQPLTINAAGRLPSLAADIVDLADLSLKVNSSFMTFAAQGATVQRANAQGNIDLVKLRDDFGALVDLSTIRSGRVTLAILNQAADQDTMETDLKVQVEDLGLDMPGAEGEPHQRLERGAFLVTAQTQYDAGKFSFVQPLRIEGTGRLLDVSTQQPRVLIDNYLQLVADLSADLNAEPSRASIAQLSIQAGRENPFLRIMLEKPTEVTLAGERGVTGNLRFRTDADLGRLQTIANRFSTEPAAGGVRSGTFSGTLFADIKADGAVDAGLENGRTDFTYVTVAEDKTEQQYADRVSVAASVALPADGTNAAIVADIAGETMKLILNAALGLNPAAEGADQLQSVNVSKLDASYMDMGSVTLIEPIVISDLPALMKALEGAPLPENTKVSGALEVRSDLAKAMPPATAEASHLTGMLVLNSRIGLKGRDVLAEIKGGITNLQVIQEGSAVVQQPEVRLGGAVRLAPDEKMLDVSEFVVNSSTGLLDLKLSTRVLELGTANRIENGRLEFTPDWPQLWPLIYAMLPPERQEKIGEIEISGRPTDVITFRGSFPADQPADQMINGLVAVGTLTLEKALWKTFGVDATGVVPFHLQQGVVRFATGTIEAPKPPEPLRVNGGTLDLSQAVIDLKTSSPTLNIPRNTLLAQKVGLNQVLVASLGTFANPLFVDPEQARGLADITVEYCERLALSTEMYDPRHPGRARILLDVYDLEVGSKGVGMVYSMFASRPDQVRDRITGEIRKGEITIANGRVDQKMDVTLGGAQFSIDGRMGLETMEYDRLTMAVPRSFVARLLEQNRVRNAEQYLPQQVGVSFTGPATALRIDQRFLSNLVADVAKRQATQALVGGLTRGESSTQPGATTRPADAIGDAIGGLIGGRREPATQPDQQQRQGGGIGGIIGDALGGQRQPSTQPAEQPRGGGGLLEGLLGPRPQQQQQQR